MKNSNLTENVKHMVEAHKFEIPVFSCMTNLKGFIKVLSKKIFTYNACLACDQQNFNNYKSLQNHMVDKLHVNINDEDIEEHLFRFYNLALITQMKDKEIKKSKTFKIIKIKLGQALKSGSKLKTVKEKESKEKAEGGEEDMDEEGWVTDEDDEELEQEEEVKTKTKEDVKKKVVKKDNDEEEDESDDDDTQPIEMPNGELLLSDGTIIGTKLYSVYYKQRVKIQKYQDQKSLFARNYEIMRHKKLQVRNSRHINTKLHKTNDLKYANTFKTRCQITC